jgi:sulfur-carrier protein adenylyltransferase/sulfurtransferase
MSVIDVFKPLDSLTATQLKTWIEENHPEDYSLLDVRQAHEFNQGHIPGAISLPVWELPDRLHELDLRLPAIVYCRFGLRSRAAAAVLHGAGCRTVATLRGGFESWDGLTAVGSLDEALQVLRTTNLEEFIATAWLLEDGTEHLYEILASNSRQEAVKHLFYQLVSAEKQHKKSLVAVFEGLFGHPPPENFPQTHLLESPADVFVEGGVPLARMSEWARGKTDLERLDLAIGLEVNAYDRYLRLKSQLNDEHLQRIVEVIAGDERRHLKLLLAAYDRVVGMLALEP